MPTYSAGQRKHWARSLALRSGQKLTWSDAAISEGISKIGQVTFAGIKRVEYEYIGKHDIEPQDDSGNLLSGQGTHILIVNDKNGKTHNMSFSWFKEGDYRDGIF